MGGLFSSTPSSQTSYSSGYQYLPPEVQKYITGAADFLTGQVGSVPTYQGVLTQAPTPTETASVTAAGIPLSTIPQATSTLNTILTGTNMDPTQNPITQNEANAVTAQVNQQYQDALRAQHGSYSSMSPAAGVGGSSGAALSDAELAGQYGLSLGNTLASLYQNQYNTAQGIQANAVPQALATPTQATQVGGAYTQEIQNALNAAYANWQNQFQMAYAPVSGFTSTAGLTQPVSSTTQYSPPGIVSLASAAAPFIKFA